MRQDLITDLKNYLCIYLAFASADDCIIYCYKVKTWMLQDGAKVPG